jgi:SET domain-containing protein
VFFTGLKGYGIRASAKIEQGDFVYEYMGEVIGTAEFERRREVYHERGDKHFYFMTIDGDEVIDATEKAGLSRLINHSCNPNCELQKWIAPGGVRMALFALSTIAPGDELTFDYKLERFGDVPRKCLCKSANCRGVFGAAKK